MTSPVYRLTDINQIINPKALLSWLDCHIGTIHRQSDTLMDNDTPAEGDTWRIVKLYQRIGNGSYQYSIFIEFQSDADLIHFKLVWG
jgi:hypothetical protein